jgi:DNA-binding beta-propeller fold protein YncE
MAVVLLFSVLRPGPIEPGASLSPTPPATPESRLLGDSPGLRLRLGNGSTPIDVISAFDSIWTADAHAGEVSRIDPASVARIARIPVPGEPAWFRVVGNELWVTGQAGFGIARIDPATSSVRAEIDTAPICSPPVFFDGAIWAAGCNGDQFVRIDPGTTSVTSIPAGGHQGIAVGGGRLVTVGADGVADLDPSTGRFTPLGAQAGAGGRLLGADDVSIWVALNQSVERIDPDTGQVIASFAFLGAQAIDLAGDHAWLTVDGRGILEIDLATNTVTRTIPLLPSPQVAREARGVLWVTDFNNGDLWRIEP